jgi:hypothetical protein
MAELSEADGGVGSALDEPHDEPWALGGGAGDFSDTNDGWPPVGGGRAASLRRRAARTAGDSGGAGGCSGVLEPPGAGAGPEFSDLDDPRP